MSRLLLLLALPALLVAAEHSASADSDIEMWSDLGVRHKLNKKWRLSVAQGLRLDDTGSSFSKSTTEAGVTYKANSWLRFGTAYRFTYTETNAGNLKVRHRFAADGQARYRHGDLRGSYRLRLQDQIRGFDGADGTRAAIRNRVKLTWLAKPKWRPYGAIELFHTDKVMDAFSHAKTRFTVGASHPMKARSLDFFYRLEVPAVATDLTVHIFGIGYALAL